MWGTQDVENTRCGEHKVWGNTQCGEHKVGEHEVRGTQGVENTRCGEV